MKEGLPLSNSMHNTNYMESVESTDSKLRRETMATTAIYTFIDNYSRYHVCKHWDNNPTGAAKFISNALKESWELPRFEADEFAAAFI